MTKKEKDAELRGFLYADGCCMLISQKRKKAYKDKVYEFVGYIPRVNVSQRSDYIDILKEFQKRFGGYITKRGINQPSHPNSYHYWQVQNFESCREIAKLMLDSPYDYPKKKAAQILYDFCNWRIKIGYRKFTEEERAKVMDWVKQMRQANSYQGIVTK